MPEQAGRRGNSVTGAPFEAPFETPTLRLGTGGVNLHQAVDTIKPEQARRLTNFVHDGNGYLIGRDGLTDLASLAGTHHSVLRIRNEITATFTRVWGIGTSLALGQTVPAVVETGFSGDPLTLTPARYDQNGLPWVLVSDRNQLRRVRVDGQVADLGVRPPTAAMVATLGDLYTTRIASFDATDATTAASWTGTAGTDVSVPTPFPAGAPAAVDVVGLSGNAVEFSASPGTAVLGYYSFWGAPIAVDLSTLQGGAVPATDDDIIHVWMRMSHPHRVTELRIYLVCSDTFSAAVLPGTDQTGVNSDAYVKAFRANDFASFIRGYNSQIEAAETARVRNVRDESLEDRAIRAPRSVDEAEVIVDDSRASWEDQRAQIDPARAVSFQAGAGAQEWVEFGNIGVPLRRSDFQRIGSTPNRNWATVTGVILFVQTNVNEEVSITLDDCFMTGGAGLDTTEPGARQYDWRYTHVDSRTNSEGNPSPEMEEGAYLDSLRRPVQLSPVGFGDSNYFQRFYRRGGSLNDDWYFVGENSGDGAAFTDEFADLAIAAAGTLEIDNYEPVPTIDENSETVLGQPVPSLWGPVEDLYFACGDPYRPGHVYFCKPGNPDSWPYNTEVSHPGDPLQAGGLLGGQAFVFSRSRLYWLYPNLTGQAIVVTAAPTACRKGLAGRWAFCTGAGQIWFVADDGVYRTTGSGEEHVSLEIDPLFHGETVEGYAPVDYAQATSLRLAYLDQEIWLTFLDTDGDYQTWILDLTTNGWRHYSFGVPIVHASEDQGALPQTILLGSTNGTTYTHSGTSDDGAAIAWTYRSGAVDFGRPREDKLFGDAYLDFASAGHELTVQTYLNAFNVTNPSQAVTSGASRARAILDAFGATPQRGRNLGVEIRGSGTGAPPILYQIGASITPQPDYTVNRVTNWDDLGHPTEKYLTGCVIECDSNGLGRTVVVEGDLGGVLTTIATFDIPAVTGRHKHLFSWTASKTHLVRVRPTDDCVGWLLYRVDWIFDPEPPRISKWDINHENSWDAYYTGLDLECNTFGLPKLVQVWVDQALVATRTVIANGRRVVHLTFGPGRGHVFRFVATDGNPGLLYAHRWHLDAEPSEQTNWNQNFTVAGALGDKYLKGIILECDTFGANKQVEVQIDGVTVETLVANANDRKVLEFSFPQHLGRVFRILPVDGNPGRLYSMQWVFDQEPLQFSRWETQETDHGLGGWHYPTYAHVTYKSAVPVTLTLTVHDQRGKSVQEVYTLPGTGNLKRKHYLQFRSRKGVLFKYLFTATSAFYLYREETQIVVQPWGAEQAVLRNPFGNDDLDATRGMVNAAAAAVRPGGAA